MGKEKRLASKCSRGKENEVSFIAIIPKHTEGINDDQDDPTILFPPPVF